MVCTEERWAGMVAVMRCAHDGGYYHIALCGSQGTLDVCAEDGARLSTEI